MALLRMTQRGRGKELGCFGFLRKPRNDGDLVHPWIVVMAAWLLVMSPMIAWSGKPQKGTPCAPMASFSHIAKHAIPAVVTISTEANVSPSQAGSAFGRSGSTRLEAYDDAALPLLAGDVSSPLLLTTVPPYAGRGAGTTAGPSAGSGFLISADGYIVTNRHVVSDAQSDSLPDAPSAVHASPQAYPPAITVTVEVDGVPKSFPARLIGMDLRSDLALLKINAHKPLPYLIFGDAKSLEVGDWVLIIGNPFGLGGSVSAGIVSSRSRDIAAQAPHIPVASYVGDLIQTDAPINDGNSGGPMLDTCGRVVGVNFAIYAPSGNSVGVGFAVPSTVVKRVINQLKDKGHVTYGWAGLHVQEVTRDIARSLDMPNEQGAMIISLVQGGPAHRAGLKMGDIITAIDGRPITSYEKVPRYIGESEVGKKIPITLWRGGKRLTIPLQVANVPMAAPEQRTPTHLPPQPTDSPRAKSSPHKSTLQESTPKESPAQGSTLLGARLALLQPHSRLNLGIPADVSGVAVDAVESGSAMAAAGVQPGDLLLELESQPLTSPAVALKILQNSTFPSGSRKPGKKAILLKIYRQGKSAFIGIPLSDEPS